MSLRIEGQRLEMYRRCEGRHAAPEDVREMIGLIREKIATQAKEKVFGTFEESSEAARLAVETYSDLLRMGGAEAAETEKPDLLKDVPDEEKETVEGGMLVLLSLHRAERGTKTP